MLPHASRHPDRQIQFLHTKENLQTRKTDTLSYDFINVSGKGENSSERL